MKKEFTRLVVAQVIFVFYSILVVGVILKLRFGSSVPADLFATHVRDYGFLLLLLPGAWGIWAIFAEHDPIAYHEQAAAVVGCVIAIILGFIALTATISAMKQFRSPGLIQMRPDATASPGNISPKSSDSR